MSAPVPTVSVLLGQGTGGAALALLPTDVAVAAEDAWLAPLPPEGASVIMHRTVDRAAGLAREMFITADDLRRLGIVDLILPGPDAPGGADLGTRISVDVRGRMTDIADGAVELLRTVGGQHPATRLAARRERYRRLPP